MAKKENEFIELMTEFQAAHTAAIVTLVRTLEEAGALKAKHYEVNLRMCAEASAAKPGPTVTQLLLDLADKFKHRDTSGSA